MSSVTLLEACVEKHQLKHSLEDELLHLPDSYLCLCWLTSGLPESTLGVSCLSSCLRLNNRLFWPIDRIYFGTTGET